jgi:hypothetical protein
MKIIGYQKFADFCSLDYIIVTQKKTAPMPTMATWSRKGICPNEPKNDY